MSTDVLDRLDRIERRLIVGSAGLAFLFALELFSRSDRLYRGVDLLAYGVAYAAVGTYVYARKNGRDLGAIVIALALALGAVGVADVLSGGGLTYAWAAEAAALAWIARGSASRALRSLRLHICCSGSRTRSPSTHRRRNSWSSVRTRLQER